MIECTETSTKQPRKEKKRRGKICFFVSLLVGLPFTFHMPMKIKRKQNDCMMSLCLLLLLLLFMLATSIIVNV